MRRMEEDEPEQAAGWMNTYADMVTLLFTFFVLLFAISNVDAMKFALLAAGLSRDGISAEDFLAIQKEYNMHGVGMPDLENPELPGFQGEDDIEENKTDDPSDPGLANDPNAPDPADGDDENSESDDTNLAELKSRINFWIDDNDMEGEMSVHEGEGDGDKLLITLTSDVFFASGSAELTDEIKKIGAILGKLLRDTQNDNNPFDVIISGHTDNIPEHSAQYRDNWGLSAARASNLMRLLKDESGLDSRCFSSRAFGEERPIADNDTPEGRQKNRRVEVLVSVLRER